MNRVDLLLYVRQAIGAARRVGQSEGFWIGTCFWLAMGFTAGYFWAVFTILLSGG